MKRIINKEKKGEFFIFKKLILIFISNIKNLSFFIVISQLTIISYYFLVYPQKAKSLLSKVNYAISNPLETTNLKDYLSYTKELANTFLPWEKNLERVDLDIKYDELLGLDCNRKFLDRVKNRSEICGEDRWQNAKLKFKSENIPVKLRAKGDRPIHRINLNKMSFKVDIRGDKRFLGMEEFAIQMPIIRNYTSELLAARLLRNENIIAPRNLYIRLYVNGEYMGIRHIEESFAKEMIEASKRRYGPIFSLVEPLSVIYDKSRFDLHDARFWNSKNPKLVRDARTILENSKKKPILIKDYFDLDLWAKYFATLDALRMWHGTYPKSVKFYLNPTTSLFEPIFYDGHMGATRLNEKYHFYKSLNTETICDDFCLKSENQFFYNSFFNSQNNENDFYRKYFNYLKKFVSKNYIENNIQPIWDDLSKERGYLYRERWPRDRAQNIIPSPHIASLEKKLSRLLFLREQIRIAETSMPLFSINDKDGNISISNELSEMPQVINLLCEEKKIGTKILIKNKKIELNKEDLNKCNTENIYWSIDNLSNKFRLIESYITTKNIELKVPKIIKKEKYIFNKGITVIPNKLSIKAEEVIFKKGSKICFENNSYLYIDESNIKFEGDEFNPNIIFICKKNIKENNGGSLIIRNSKVDINNLISKDLNSPKIDLTTLYGSMNFIKSDVKFNNLYISNSNSEDAINFIDSKIKGNFLKIENAFSDSIDLDASEMNIKEISCYNSGNDCLDLSFSNSYVKKLNANGVKDKVISLGENSKLEIEKIIAKESEIGIVSKDSSYVKVKNFNFLNLKIPIAAYVKKQEFQPPEIIIDKAPIIDSKNLLISDDSYVKINGIKINSGKKSEEINKLLYGKVYGVKTIRQ